MSFHYPIGGGSGGGGVTSLNTLTGALNILSGDGIDINTSGSDITISALGASVDNTTLEVKVATTAALPGTPTYDNGTAGVGATLTRSSNGTTGTIDGITAANLMAGDRILVKNQSAQLRNGIYEVTQQGSASLPYILTRTADADTTAEMDDMVVVASSGTTNKGAPFGQQTNNPTIGTNNIVFTATGIYVKQQSSGTQAAGQIPYYASAAMTITKGDSLFFRDIASKVTLIGTDIELVEPIITSTGALFTGVFAELFIGSGAVVAENTDDTNIAYSVAIIGDDGKPNGGILGGVRGTGAFIGAMEAGQHDSVYDKPYVGYTAQIAGQGGGLDYRNVLRSDAAGTRIKSDNLFVLDASRGEIRLRQTSSSTDWWEIPVIAGAEGYVLTAHGDGAEATWEPGGGSAAGNNTNVQFNDGGLFGGSDLFTWDDAISTFNAISDFETEITNPSFSGGGLNDMTNGGTYTGTTTRLVKIEIDGFREEISYNALTGGTFTVGQTVDFLASGAQGTVEVDDGVGTMTVLITNGIHPVPVESIDNGAGVTADLLSIDSSVDTFAYYIDFLDGAGFILQLPFVEITGSPQVPDDGMFIEFAATSGHTVSEFWTFYGVQLLSTFLTNNFDISSISGGLPASASGAMYRDDSLGIKVISGLFQSVGTPIPLPSDIIVNSSTNQFYSSGWSYQGSNEYSWRADSDNGIGDTSYIALEYDKFIFGYGGAAKMTATGYSFDYNAELINLGDLSAIGNSNVFSIQDGSNLISTIFSDSYEVKTNVDSEIVFGAVQSADQVKVGWTSSGLWQLFDKDTLKITFGDVNGDVNGYQFGFDVSSGTFSTSAFLNILSGAIANPGLEVSTGGGYTISNGVPGLLYDPASVEATATINMPNGAVDGQLLSIYFGGTITTGNPVVTALTLTPTGGASIIGNVPPGADSGNVLKFRYVASNTTWYRDN